MILAGCASLGTVAPPVSAAMIGASHGATAETLEAGRRILATRCAACHQVYPIANYSPSDWRRIVQKMAHRAKLDDQQKAAVVAYLTAAHDLPPTP